MSTSMLTTSFKQAPGVPLPDRALSYLEEHVGAEDMRDLPPSHVMADGLSLSPRSRLAFRAQPSDSIVTDNPHRWVSAVVSHMERGYRDLSASYLEANIVICIMAGLLKEEDMQAFHELYGKHDEDAQCIIDVLTFLDAFATLPEASKSNRMAAWVQVISKLVRKAFVAQRSLWQNAQADSSPLSRETRLKFCLAWSLCARLVFYTNRMGGRSLKKYNIELERLREQSGIPSDWNVQSEIRKLQTEWDAEMAAQPEAQLKWDGEPVDVCEVSTPASAEDMVDNDCVICSDSAAPPAVLTKPCRHLYCQDCLKTWIHACQRQSHTCPACRTELFPKPDYVLDNTQSREEQQAIENAIRGACYLNIVRESLSWLKEERALQKRYERKHR